MRRSNLLSRKSPSIKKTLVITGLLTALIVGCSVRYGYLASNAPSPAAADDDARSTNVSFEQDANTSDTPATAPLRFFAFGPEGKRELLAVESSSCGGSGLESNWHLRVRGPVVNHELRFSINHAGALAQSALVLDKTYRYFLPSANLTAIDRALCQAMTSGEPQGNKLRLENSKLINELSVLLSSLLADCNVTWHGDQGWSCRLRPVAASDGGRALSDSQQHLLKRWSRQPYLLSRRLTVTRTLQKALKSPNANLALNELCQVLAASLPAELPMVLGSPLWQQAVCKHKGPGRLTLAALGLDRAVDEITFFLNLGDTIASQGHLTIRLPEGALKTEEIWVKLHPRRDVATRVLATALKMTTKEGGRPALASAATEALQEAGEQERELPRIPEDELNACWHPLFSSSPAALRLATMMGLSGPQGPLCQKINLTQTAESLQHSQSGEVARYLSDTIMGETDFILSNGRFKILRLPQGFYDYTLVGLPESALRWRPELAADKAQGTIGWISKKPRPSIVQW